jgi:hypothetical protein
VRYNNSILIQTSVKELFKSCLCVSSTLKRILVKQIWLKHDLYLYEGGQPNIKQSYSYIVNSPPNTPGMGENSSRIVFIVCWQTLFPSTGLGKPIFNQFNWWDNKCKGCREYKIATKLARQTGVYFVIETSKDLN